MSFTPDGCTLGEVVTFGMTGADYYRCSTISGSRVQVARAIYWVLLTTNLTLDPAFTQKVARNVDPAASIIVEASRLAKAGPVQLTGAPPSGPAPAGGLIPEAAPGDRLSLLQPTRLAA